MAYHLPISRSFPKFTFIEQQPKLLVDSQPIKHASFSFKIKCMGGVSETVSSENIVRRSGNYQPSIWNYDFVQSLSSEFKDDVYVRRICELKEQVRDMVNNPMMNTLDKLELIDLLQRLGIDYHFEDEIQKQLMNISNSRKRGTIKDFHAVALEFRLMRQHGFHISQDVFNDFQDQTGNFKTCISENLEGMLSLYESSYLSEEGETVLEVARDFTTTYLTSYIEKNDDDDYISMLISHALEMPLHWRMLRLEARWFIDVYERKPDMNYVLLELAKLDFNYVQAIHQEDLKFASRWWSSTGLGEKLSFSRDRILENFSWTVGMMFQPELSYCRRMSVRVNALITAIDDIYDVYGTMDELELFTDAVERTS